MDAWLRSAADYISDWIEFQLTTSQQPGVIVAIAHRGEIVAEHAFGVADLDTGEKLTPRHRFRIASHSKSFTAAGIMKLREAGKLRLDDPIGEYVKGLHPQIGEATISQLLSHSAGLIRDGADAGFFEDRRPFPNVDQVMADLQDPPVIEPNMRHKYSNHGFGLLGLAIEAVTGEPHRTWIKHEIIEAAGLEATEPDMPIPNGVPFARGHTGELFGLTGQIVAGVASTGGVVLVWTGLSLAVRRFFTWRARRRAADRLSISAGRENAA